MAEIHGFIAPGYERVRDVFAAHLDSGEEMGGAFAAIANGVTLVDIWGGVRDRARTKPWERDTIVPVYSATKPISALAVARVCHEHKIGFDTPVSLMWPEFGVEGKDKVTIGQALAHQAGVPGFVHPIDPALWLDPPALAEELAAAAPLWPPGNASGYHPLTWGYLVGEIVRRIAGRSLGTILREDICAPLGADFQIGLPDADMERVGDVKRPPRLPALGEITARNKAAFLEKWSQPDRGGPEWRRAEIPSANGHGTARAIAQLYALYISDDGDVLARAARDALTQRYYLGPDLVLPFTLDWRAGIIGNNTSYFGPNPNTLGHYGWGGSCGLADPDHGLSAGYITNKQSAHLMGDPRAVSLIEALYACFG